MDIGFSFSGIDAKSTNPGLMLIHVSFYKKSPNYFPELLYQFIFLPVMYD